MIELNDLLVKEGLNPCGIFVVRHRPTEKTLRDVLPWLSEEQPRLYNAYQSQHGERVENALSKATHLVSCIGHTAGKAIFVGLYTVKSFKRLSAKAYWAMPEIVAIENTWKERLHTRSPLGLNDN